MKAILMVDKMPKMCIGCPLNLADSSVRCRKTWTGDSIPEWCPLKPMPERMKVDYETISSAEVSEKVIAIGWNACLKELEK